MESKTIAFCESVHVDTHNAPQNGGFRKRHRKWISTKTEVFENTPNQFELIENEGFWKRPNGQKWSSKTGLIWKHKNGCLWLHNCCQVDQSDRTNTDVFPPFLYENGVLWTGRFHVTKTAHKKNRAMWTGPNFKRFKTAYSRMAHVHKFYLVYPGHLSGKGVPSVCCCCDFICRLQNTIDIKVSFLL